MMKHLALSRHRRTNVWLDEAPNAGPAASSIVRCVRTEALPNKQTSFAALALRVLSDLLRSAPTWLKEVANSLDDIWLERALEPAVAEAERLRNTAQAERSVRAEHIARLRLGATFEAATLDTARKHVLTLRAAQPGIVASP
jgi:hypothetical protein